MWIDKPEDEESQKATIDTGEGPSVGAGAGGGAPQIQGSTTAAVGTPSSMSPTPEAPGQKFGTIQDYFKGSKSQGEQLGQQFTGKLEDVKQKQQGAIGQAAAGAEQDIAANTVGFDQGLVSKAASDPTKIANDDAQFDSFMKQWNAAYKGPESFEATDKYNTATKAVQDAQSKATQVGSTGGRQQMLQDEFGVYGQGNKGLDEALIQQSGSFGDIGTKAKELNSLQDYLKSKSSDVATKAQEAKATTEQTKQKAQDALLGDTGAVKQFKTDIDVRTAQERAAAEKSTKDLQTAVASNANLTDQQLGMLGVSRDQYNQLLAKQKEAGLEPNLKNYLTSQNPNAKISRESVAKEGDFAKDQALAKLTGGSKFLGDATKSGKLVDFASDKALQDYLDKIGADKATRDAAERQRIADQEAEAARRDAEKTAKREDTQNQIIGGIAVPGLNLIAPGIPGAVGEKISDIINKDKVANKIQDYIGKQSQKVIDAGKIVGGGIASTVNNIASTIGGAFGLGGGKKDVVVNLPELNLPTMAVPKTADAATAKAIADIFTKPLNTAGSYHEGSIGDMTGRLDVLKSALTNNQISPEEYTTYATPLAEWTRKAYQKILSSGHTAGKTVEGQYPAFQQNYGNLLAENKNKSKPVNLPRIR